MKSMTDFIMEQETPVVAEEQFNEAALVSDYMAMCAAMANIQCIAEFATIASFCEANDITKPAVIQEGEILDKIWNAISGFFEKIATWFKSLVKGAAATFAHSKLAELIAKYKTLDPDSELKSDKKEQIYYMMSMSAAIIEALKMFKELCLDPDKYYTTKSSGSSTNDTYNALKGREKAYNELDDLLTDLKLINDTKKWKTVENTAVSVDAFKFDQFKEAVTTTVNAIKGDSNANPPVAAKELKISQLVAALELINSLKIPATSAQLLKELEYEEKKFKQYTVEKQTTAKGNTSTKDAEDTAKKTETIDTEMTKRINDVSKEIVKAYDKITGTFLYVSSEGIKDIQVDATDKKQYDKEVARAEKAAGKYDSSDIDKPNNSLKL